MIDFLKKVEESDNFVFLNYNSADDFINDKDPSAYLIIRHKKTDDFQFKVTRSTDEPDKFKIMSVVITDDTNEFSVNASIKDHPQIDKIIRLTANALKDSKHKRYAKDLEALK